MREREMSHKELSSEGVNKTGVLGVDTDTELMSSLGKQGL